MKKPATKSERESREFRMREFRLLDSFVSINAWQFIRGIASQTGRQPHQLMLDVIKKEFEPIIKRPDKNKKPVSPPPPRFTGTPVTHIISGIPCDLLDAFYDACDKRGRRRDGLLMQMMVRFIAETEKNARY